MESRNTAQPGYSAVYPLTTMDTATLSQVIVCMGRYSYTITSNSMHGFYIAILSQVIVCMDTATLSQAILCMDTATLSQAIVCMDSI